MESQNSWAANDNVNTINFIELSEDMPDWIVMIADVCGLDSYVC